jgi:hypothetical protein
MVERLTDIAEVVHERWGEGLQAAFEVHGYPVFAVVDAGGVVRSSKLDGVPTLAPT